MKVLGIIAEYNPFHNGHLYHLQECKDRAEADFVVAVMSGNFTQRGEPAVMDKWTRSRLAVQCGVNLVLELPFAYAVNSAEYFAKGGVGILHGLGCVTHLGFGSEGGQLQKLETIADVQTEESEEFREILKKSMSAGDSYAKGREKAIVQLLGAKLAKEATTPNNILAIEYMKQLKLHNSSIRCVTVNRKGAGYFDLKPAGNIASATAIRTHLNQQERKQFVPTQVAAELERAPRISGYDNLVRSTILRTSPEDLAEIFSVGEGLEHRIKDQVRRTSSLEELIAAVKSKRYPETRIRRIFCQMVVGLKAFNNSYYGRILAADHKGMKLIKWMKQTASIPIITNINKELTLSPLIHYDILAGDIYNLISGCDLYQKCDYVVRPYFSETD